MKKKQKDEILDKVIETLNFIDEQIHPIFIKKKTQPGIVAIAFTVDAINQANLNGHDIDSFLKHAKETYMRLGFTIESVAEIKP